MPYNRYYRKQRKNKFSRRKGKGDTKSKRQKQFHQLRFYPDHLRGPATNRYGGNNLQILRGLRGGTYGPASRCKIFSKEEIEEFVKRREAHEKKEN